MNNVKIILIGLAGLQLAWAAASQPNVNPAPLTRVHSHNDYEQARPLFEALERGFCSVEADIYLVDGQLLVAHERNKVTPERSLQSLYLDPLRRQIKANGGRVYRDGPECYLLIDIKSEAESTYAALDGVLKGYADILTVFQAGETKTNALTVIVSGNRSLKTMAAQSVRYAAYDGRLTDLESTASAALIPWISDNWGFAFQWRGVGQMPTTDRVKLTKIIEQAHQQGRKARFWAIPDRPEVWQVLYEAGVDFLNTDKLAEMQKFLLAKNEGKSGQTQTVAIKDGEKIAFLGDSITQQGAGSPAGYVRLVISGLEANGVRATAIPAGISGHKSDQMLARLERDVISKKPDWMTLSCGVNDVWHGERGVPLEPYKRNITEIVNRCQAAGIKVMILTATMIGEDQGNTNNQTLVAYNDFLRALAKEKPCLMADLNADMQAAVKTIPGAPPRRGNLLTSDGVHMNPTGNLMMATGILRAFGLSEAQLQKARDAWFTIPRAAEVSGRVSLSLRQYQELSARATKENRSVNDLVNEQFNQLIEGLLQRR